MGPTPKKYNLLYNIFMRKHPWVTGEYYHIYNRGVDKRDIFMSKDDLERFALSVKEFNTIRPIGSIQGRLKDKSDSDRLKVESLGDFNNENNKPLVSIVNFSFLPNHFHFILKQEVDGGVSEFAKRLLGGYTTYFNQTHERSGALFQGRFKSCVVDNEQYLIKIRPYANMNDLVHDIPEYKKHLVKTSSVEYDSMNFDIISKKEAEELLKFYGSSENFRKECLEIIDIIRLERGKTSLQEDDLLP